MLDDLYLEGAAYDYVQVTRNGNLDWDLASVVGPRGALLFALDLAYEPDPDEKVFTFGPPRSATFSFRLPDYLRQPVDVFRVDADDVHDVERAITGTGIEIRDAQSRVAIYVASPTRGLRDQIETRRQQLVAEEEALGFDPARDDADYEALAELVP